MVVAVAFVRVVEVVVHEKVDVVAVRDRLVATPFTVRVLPRVARAVVLRRAAVGMRFVDCDGVLVNVVAVRMVEVSVVQVVDMPLVEHCGMPAGGTVLVFVLCMDLVASHIEMVAHPRRLINQMQAGRVPIIHQLVH